MLLEVTFSIKVDKLYFFFVLGFLRAYLGWALNYMPQKNQCLFIFLSQYYVQKYLVYKSP